MLLPLLTLLTAAAAQADAAECVSGMPLSSISAAPVVPQLVETLTPEMTAAEIVNRLGPPASNTGSGLFKLAWNLADGRVFAMTFGNPCLKPLFRSDQRQRSAETPP